MAKRIEEMVVYEKDAPKTRAFGVRTSDGVLIKVWIPKDLVGKDVKEFPIVMEIPSKGKGKKSKQKEVEEEDDEDEFDEDDDDDDDDADEEDEEPPRRKKRR